MKRFCIVLGFLALLLGMVSCQKDQTVIRATISRYQNDQKVYIDGDNYACWEGDEQVFLNGNTYSLTTHDDNSFEIAMTGDHPSGTLLNAIYPSGMVVENTYSSTSATSTSSTSATSTIRIELPATQDYEVDGQGRQIIQAPMAAQVETGRNGGATLDFNNICSLLKVQVHTNVFVHSITVNVLEGGISLAGQGTVNFNNKTLVMDDNGASSITLNVDACRSDGIYYVVVPPYATNARLEVVVYDNPHSIIKSGQASGHQLPKNKIVTVNCIDGGKGLFSISSNARVSFAKGNLTGSNGSYAFNESQTETGGQYSSIPTDLPTSITNDWILLTHGEWDYLLGRTCNGHNLYARASLDLPNGTTVQGLILLPDNWDNLGCSEAANINYDNPNMNSFTYERWNVIEEYGAVFLPAIAEAQNHYWTSEQNYAIKFGNDSDPVVEHNPNTNGPHKIPQIRHAILVEGSRQ